MDTVGVTPELELLLELLPELELLLELLPELESLLELSPESPESAFESPSGPSFELPESVESAVTSVLSSSSSAIFRFLQASG